MRIEIWSDIVSPYCYFGLRNFETALARLGDRDQPEIILRAFELDPGAPARAQQTLAETLIAKTGQSAEQIEAVLARISQQAADYGLVFRLEMARPAKTFSAHRLLYHAAAEGKSLQALERLQRAYFCEGEDLGEPENLVRLLSQIGLDAQGIEKAYISSAYENEVDADFHEALIMGVSSLPYVMIDGEHALTGAQTPDAWLAALDRAGIKASRIESAPALRSLVAPQRRSLPRKRKK